MSETSQTILNIYCVWLISLWIYGWVRGDKSGNSSLFEMPLAATFYGLWYSPKKWTLWTTIVLGVSLFISIKIF